MAKLTKDQRTLAEAIDTMLQHDAKLGLKIHDTTHERLGESERGYEYLHGQIDDMFTLKAAELLHSESVCQAFHKVHSYKYLDDPTFQTAMEKEMVAQAVPKEEREKATKFVPTIISELKTEQSEWAEKDFGFNPSLDEVKEASQPEQPLDFQIEDVDGWPSDANIEWGEIGDASPSRTPSD
jgi:hypothetical protein